MAWLTPLSIVTWAQVSNDGLHFREPVPDFRMVPCAEDESTLAEEPWTEQHKLVPNVVDFPANVQGNGMENVGDKTLFWYGTWPEVDADGVRCASWDRDRALGRARYSRLRAPRGEVNGQVRTEDLPMLRK